MVRAEWLGDGVLGVGLDRPECRNALDLSMVEGLFDALGVVGLRVLVLSSASPGWFCSGADLNLDDATRAKLSRRLYELYEAMLSSPALVVAAPDGPAVGGGAQLVVASDLVVASPRTRLRFVGMAHGLVVGAWGLLGAVGRGRTVQWCATMRWVEADEALAAGVFQEIVSDPVARATELAVGLAEIEPAVLRRLKRLVAEPTLLGRLRAEAAQNADWDGQVGSRLG